MIVYNLSCNIQHKDILVEKFSKPSLQQRVLNMLQGNMV